MKKDTTHKDRQYYIGNTLEGVIKGIKIEKLI